MLRRVIVLALMLLLAGFAASFLARQQGMTAIEWLGYRIEIKTSLLVTGMISVMILLVLLDRLLSFLAGLPGRLGDGIRQRRKREGHQALALGLVAASVGDQGEATKQAKRARKLIGGDTLTGLLDAQVATLKGDTAAASRFFENLAGNRATAWLGHAGTMRLEAEAGNDQAALEAGRAAFAARRNEPALARALFALEARHGDWPKAIAALTVARRHAQNGKDRDEADAAMAVLHYQHASQQRENGDQSAALKTLEAALAAQPGLVPAVLAAADLHAARGKTRKTVAVLEKGFLATPHPDLADRLMLAWPGDEAGNLARLMRLSDKAGNPPEALSACATIALRLELWGEARRLAELIPEARRDAAIWSVLAEAARHAPEDASPQPDAPNDAKAWPDADACLNAAARAPRAPAWTCRQCGTIAPAWQPACPQCDAFASLNWAPASAAKLTKPPLPTAPD